MIAFLTGKARRKHPDSLIVDVAGVGYQVYIPLTTYSAIPDNDNEVSLHIHTHLREDALTLFGFSTEAEKEAFLLLLGVSGVGPRLALAILSALPVGDFAAAVMNGDEAKLVAIPGIGKKTAARMVLELRDKARQLAPSSAAQAHPGRGPSAAPEVDDALSALVNLGYKKPHVEEALKKVVQRGQGKRLEELIREALGELGKG